MIQKMAEDSLDAEGYFQPEMCPVDERFMRTENDLIHACEIGPNGAFRLVKRFSRPSAGQKFDIAEIRSPELCLRTAKYLILDVLGEYDMDRTKYHFVFDRLRAIRQDLVLQNCKDVITLRILEICVRFHLLAQYRLCNAEARDFDAHINSTHLLDCVKDIMILYEELRIPYSQRTEMSAVYLMFNLGRHEAFNWASRQPKIFRKGLLKPYTEAFLAHARGNFVRLFRLVSLMSLSAKLAFFRHWQDVIRNSVKIYAVAFSSKNLTYPMSTFCVQLRAIAEQDRTFVDKVVRESGMAVTSKEEDFETASGEKEKNIHFLKTNLKAEGQIKVNTEDEQRTEEERLQQIKELRPETIINALFPNGMPGSQIKKPKRDLDEVREKLDPHPAGYVSSELEKSVQSNFLNGTENELETG